MRARSKNARTATIKTKVESNEKILREHFEAYIADNPQFMYFRDVAAGSPDEGKLVLVRLTDGSFRFGMVLKGRFANYEYHNEEFVTFAHPDRITHWMEVRSPVPYSAEADEPMTEYPEPPGESIEQAAIAAAQEDVYL